MFRLFTAVAFACLLAAIPIAPSGAEETAAFEARCDRVAPQPSGAGRAALRILISELDQGDMGCLRAGTYRLREIRLRVPRVTLTSYPGERATVVGRVWVSADGVKVKHLNLNGHNPTNLPSPTVTANDTVFRGNDVTNDHTAICFNLGSTTRGHASRTLIENNRIHHCGRLPATNYDHGIYVAHADDTVIRDNLIYANADRGIQLYPDADGSVITGNVIDGNGQGIIFGGNETMASSDNSVVANVITNSTIRHNVESSWARGGPVGKGNLVTANCLYGGVRDDGSGGIQTPQIGFAAVANAPAEPLPGAFAGASDTTRSCEAALGLSG